MYFIYILILIRDSIESMLNTHNSYLWAHENPHAKRLHACQERFSVNVWARIAQSLSRMNSTSRLTGHT